jgi:hypothetical protein
VWGTSTFSSSLVVGGAALEKGAIVGSAKLDSEDFACFRDGVGSFSIDVGGWGPGGQIKPEIECKVDVWCGSIQVGK